MGLKLLTVPEQVYAQGELLETRTQAGVDVPALLHDLMYLRGETGRKRIECERVKQQS